MPCPRCGLIYSRGMCPTCRQVTAAQRRALRRYEAAIRRQNAEIERGNRRRRECLLKIIAWCMRGDEVRAKVWVTKLVAAGFDPDDGAVMERMTLAELEDVCRRTLGLRPRLTARGDGSGQAAQAGDGGVRR
ncbi:MAG TPA: hypothetical protein VIK99_01175 [Thermaerobacter sp.]